MRISVVTDIHGNVDALARIADKAERLVILGDLLDYVDYHDPARGIMGEMFGVDAVTRFSRLRARGQFGELRRLNGQLWSTLADPVGTLSGIVRERYRAVLDVLPPDTVLTLGNVDVADEWDHVAGQVLPYRDAEAVIIDGVRFGFVAGGVRQSPVSPPDGQSPAPWRPLVRPADAYRAAVAALGPVDVLCSHLPPDISPLRYDVVPGRAEMAGPGLTDYMLVHRPLLALFGHVHQPQASRARLGWTECVNAGHFQRAERPLIIDTERLRAAARTGR